MYLHRSLKPLGEVDFDLRCWICSVALVGGQSHSRPVAGRASAWTSRRSDIHISSCNAQCSISWGDVPLLMPQLPRGKMAKSGMKPELRAEIPAALADWVADNFTNHYRSELREMLQKHSG